ncbi:hypothetical protein GCM10009678_32960 [Actinomadura kijaniata]|uniref:Uncharacterized protein n=1 Tax=Actinomadura namibiensis TaxID=182080 RepID=A0A7W3LMR6_ACTNM|nr:hypothetical protein [Actinomadura namibiensis]MBA8950974.1 hypothetical protein [Actinomadura namibiensis]
MSAPTWLDAALTNGTALTPGAPERSEIFDAVRAAPEGAVARRLLARAAEGDRTALTLLGELVPWSETWHAAATVAVPHLLHDDPGTRRTAAVTVARAGGPDLAAALLLRDAGRLVPEAAGVAREAGTVARTALAEAASWRFTADDLAALRRDPDPSVRLVAALSALHGAAPEERPAIEDALRADLRLWAETDSPVRQDVGARWAAVHIYREDREEHCYALAAELLAADQPPRVREVGVEVARAAFHTWRAAFERLAPLVHPLLDVPELRDRAAGFLELHSDAIRQAADVPPPPPDAEAVRDLLDKLRDGVVTRDVSFALRRVPPEALAPVVPVLTERLLVAFRRGDDTRGLVDALGLAGPAAAPAVPLLRAMLAVALDDGGDTSGLVEAFRRIGPAAAPAVPLLRRLDTAAAAITLVEVTGDRRWAEEMLNALPDGPRPLRTRLRLLERLLDHGGLDDGQERMLRELFARSGLPHVRVARLLWRHAGAAVAEEVATAVAGHIGDEYLGPEALRLIAEMGPSARAALPQVEAVIERRRRLPSNMPSAEQETVADERQLALARRARARILAEG